MRDGAADQLRRDLEDGRRRTSAAAPSAACATSVSPRRCRSSARARERRAARAARRATCRPRRPSTPATSPARAPRGTPRRARRARRCAAASSRRSSCDSVLPASSAVRTSPATTPCASRKGTPRRTSRSATSVAAISSSEAAAAIRSRSKRTPRDHAGGGGERQLERVDGVEQVLLVLLQVLVVGERQRVHHAVEGGQVADHARRLRAQQLGRVGVLLLRHDRGARAPGVGQLAEAELGARPQHELGAQAREVGRAGRGGVEVVEHEVAAGDRVDRVRRDLGEAELLGDHAPVGVEVHARQRARAERQRARPALRRRRSARGRASSIQK